VATGKKDRHLADWQTIALTRNNWARTFLAGDGVPTQNSVIKLWSTPSTLTTRVGQGKRVCTRGAGWPFLLFSNAPLQQSRRRDLHRDCLVTHAISHSSISSGYPRHFFFT